MNPNTILQAHAFRSGVILRFADGHAERLAFHGRPRPVDLTPAPESARVYRRAVIARDAAGFDRLRNPFAGVRL